MNTKLHGDVAYLVECYSLPQVLAALALAMMLVDLRLGSVLSNAALAAFDQDDRPEPELDDWTLLFTDLSDLVGEWGIDGLIRSLISFAGEGHVSAPGLREALKAAHLWERQLAASLKEWHERR